MRMCEKKTRAGEIRTLLVGRREEFRNEAANVYLVNLGFGPEPESWWCLKYPHIPGKFDTKRGGINGVFFSALWRRKS